MSGGVPSHAMAALVHLQPGTIFARDFRVVRPLSEGGMGAVYVVEQLSTGKERALKIMLPQLVADASWRYCASQRLPRRHSRFNRCSAQVPPAR